MAGHVSYSLPQFFPVLVTLLLSGSSPSSTHRPMTIASDASAQSVLLSVCDHRPAYDAVSQQFNRQSDIRGQYPITLQLLGTLLLVIVIYGFISTVFIVQGAQ